MKMNNTLLLRQNEEQFAIEEQVQNVQVKSSSILQIPFVIVFLLDGYH